VAAKVACPQSAELEVLVTGSAIPARCPWICPATLVRSPLNRGCRVERLTVTSAVRYPARLQATSDALCRIFLSYSRGGLR
jgi:hypothetical protein